VLVGAVEQQLSREIFGNHTSCNLISFSKWKLCYRAVCSSLSARTCQTNQKYHCGHC